VLTTDVAPGSTGGGIELSAPSPNPSGGDVALRFTLPRGGHARLVVLDLAGRRVRTLADHGFAAGEQAVRWDGRADDGALVRAGMYFARLEADGGSRTTRIVRLR
jgi:flagellar basal-body rod modification protein FlgD